MGNFPFAVDIPGQSFKASSPMKTNSKENSPAAAPSGLLFPSLPSELVTVGGYTVRAIPGRSARPVWDSMRSADFSVSFSGPETGRTVTVEVNLYFSMASPLPFPVAYGRNGADGGELRWICGWKSAGPGRREAIVELEDFDGAECLPKSVCATLRALDFTVSDDFVSSPL